MIVLLSLLLLLSSCHVTVVSSERILTVASVGELSNVLDTAVAGDIVQLSAGTYELMRTLTIRRSVTLRSSAGARAVFRGGTPDLDVLIAVVANDVTVRDIIFGRSGNDRAIDILVGAGQHIAATNGNGVAYNTAASLLEQQKRKRSLDVIRNPSSIVIASGGLDVANRALRNFALINVDFSASQSAVNVAFEAGAYLGVVLKDSVFSSYSRAKAIVSVAGALFTNSDPISRNVFGRAPMALLGKGLTIGVNYWVNGAPKDVVYCLDRHCTSLAPVVDGDAPATKGFTNIVSAVNAGTHFILVTAQEIELGGTVVINVPGSRIEGVHSEKCTSSSTLLLSSVNDTIRSAHGALTSFANLRVLLSGGAKTIIHYGEEIDGTSKDALASISNVVVLGSPDSSSAFVLDSQFTQITVSNCIVTGVPIGVELHRGSLIVTDSTFAGNEQASISVLGSGANTGLRVSGSLFVGAPNGSIVFDKRTKSELLLEFYVSCSRFVFGALQEPSDCSGAVCANALSHNTFIEDTNTIVRGNPNRRFLARGGNHVQRVSSAKHFNDYVHFIRQTPVAGSTTHLTHHHTFELIDHQGRLAAVRATVNVADSIEWSFALASYVPMRQECFAGSLPILEKGDAPRVVSNLFELSSDAPTNCISLALRFAIVNSDATLQDGTDLAVYDVHNIGNSARGGAEWHRAPSHSVFDSGKSGVIVEASGGAGTLLRAAVIAAHATDEERAASLNSGTTSGVIAVQRAKYQLCVACGDTEFPAHVIDERCGGGTDQSVFSDFDSAFASATELIASGNTVSLLIYGDQCVTKACTIPLPGGVFTMEGLSTSQRGTIHRPVKCASAVPFVVSNDVSEEGGKETTLRFLLLAPEKSISSAVPRCVVEISGKRGPRVAFSTLSGGVCISTTSASVVIGNDISPVAGNAAIVIDGNALLEANTLNGDVSVEANGIVRIDRNTFSSNSAVRVKSGSATLTDNSFVDRVLDVGDNECVTSSNGADISSVGDSFGIHCLINLVGGARGKIRVSGAHTEWRDVRLSIRGGSRDVRISNVALMGSNTAIGVLDGEKSNVILHNVALNTKATKLSDTLIGGASARSKCAAKYEAALQGFDIAHSVVIDSETKRILLNGVAKVLTDDKYVDVVTGDVTSCYDTPDAEYCQCVSPTVKESDNREQQQQQQQNEIVFDKYASDATRRVAIRPNIAANVVVQQTDAPTSLAMQLLPLWIALAIVAVCFIGVLLFCFCAVSNNSAIGTGSDSTVASSAQYRHSNTLNVTNAGSARERYASLGLTLHPADAENGMRHRNV